MIHNSHSIQSYTGKSSDFGKNGILISVLSSSADYGANFVLILNRLDNTDPSPSLWKDFFIDKRLVRISPL